MAQKWILNIFGKEKDDSAEVLDVLARNRTPIQVEIEKSLIRFNSQLSIKEKAVIIAKPLTLGPTDLRTGGHVRIRWPGAGRREMRLEVAAPHFNLPNGNAGFVCKTPDGSAMPKRNHERYDVSRFNNLRLEVGTGSFRVIDLCVTGCRLAMTTNSSGTKIAMGREVEEAVLVVGKDSKIIFERLIPRSQRKGFVGCEFKVKQDGKSPKILAQVIKSVQTRQFDLINAKA
jgi:hypothetical protein